MLINFLTIPGSVEKGTRWPKQSKRHAGSTAPNKAQPGSVRQNNIIMEFLPALSQMHYPPRLLWGAGPACPDGRPARAPSSPASCRAAKAALRRGFGRNRSGSRVRFSGSGSQAPPGALLAARP